MSRKKNRGVRASRIKLAAALSSSKITPKKQIALANAIADREGLDSAPRDLVNKVFREFPVDPQTLERVATVLGVEAQSLYLTDEDLQVRHVDSFRERPKNKKNTALYKRVAAGLVFFLSLSLGLNILLVKNRSDASNGFSVPCEGLGVKGPKTAAGKLGIVIGKFSSDPDNEVQSLLADAFMSDKIFQDRLVIFTSCRQYETGFSSVYVDQLRALRQGAQDDLRAADAQVFVWGERFGDRLNIRFASLRDDNEAFTIQTDKKPITSREASFSVPMKISADKKVPVRVKKIALALMAVNSDDRKNVLEVLKSKFDSSGEWLRDAVQSDKNLLLTISPEDEPVFYALTGNQLCYRYRMLGDYEFSESVYEEAEGACRDVLKNVTEPGFEDVRARLSINLGTVLVRKHNFAKTLQDRYLLLNEARQLYESVEKVDDFSALDTDVFTFNNNLSLVYLRLGELVSGQEGLDYIYKALKYAKTAMPNVNPARQAKNYASAKQNLCLIGHRLADRTSTASYAKQAAVDCTEALKYLSATREPQIWGMVQNNLAVSYAVYAGLKKDSGAFKQAIEEFGQAQNVFTKDRFPVNWGEVEVNMAELNCRLSLLTGESHYLDESLLHGRAALKVFIENNVARYADYATKLISITQQCDRQNIGACQCSG